MKVKLGRDGRLAIPAEFSERLRIRAGDILALQVKDGDARLRRIEHTHARQAVNGPVSSSDLKSTVQVSSSGAIELPSETRQHLGMKHGDTVIMIIEDGNLIVYTFVRLNQHVRDMARRYPPSDGRLVSEELIRERRAEARAEERYG